MHSCITRRGIYLDSHPAWVSSTCWLLRRLVTLQKKPSGLFFIERGIRPLSSGSRPVSNACLPCKQAAGSAPSCSVCAEAGLRAAKLWHWSHPYRSLTACANRPFKHFRLYLYFICHTPSLLHTRLCTTFLDALCCVCARTCALSGRGIFIARCWHGSPLALHGSQQEQG